MGGLSRERQRAPRGRCAAVAGGGWWKGCGDRVVAMGWYGARETCGARSNPAAHAGLWGFARRRRPPQPRTCELQMPGGTAPPRPQGGPWWKGVLTVRGPADGGLRTTRPTDRTTSYGVKRAGSASIGPSSRRRRRHRGGHHDPGETPRHQPDPDPAGHRGPDHRRHARPNRLGGRDHPDGARRESEVLDLGRRNGSPTGPADRHQTPRPALHHPRLRMARRAVPRPPQHPWSRGGKTNIATGTRHPQPAAGPTLTVG